MAASDARAPVRVRGGDAEVASQPLSTSREIRAYVAPAATAAAVGAYFLALSKDALQSYFSPDDFMNLYRAWDHPVGEIIKANLLFFLNSPFGRPMASAWHRLMFATFGFSPVSFHVIQLVILGLNIWLTFAVVRRLARSREAGVLAALLVSFHGAFAPLYFDTAYIYDVLCYFFYFAAFLMYVRIRSDGRALRGMEVAACTSLYICALNSKEIALTLPFFLAAYEFLYHRPPLIPVRGLLRWSWREGRAILITGVVSVAFVIGRAQGSESILRYPDYQPQFSAARFFETSIRFTSQLFFMRKWTLTPAMIIGVWLVLFAVVWITRSRALKFAWILVMVTPLPVAFIAPRIPAQYYVPYFGWVLYAAVALTEGSRWLLRGAPELAQSAWAMTLCTVVAAIMYSVNVRYPWSQQYSVSVEGEELRAIVTQLHHLRPTMRHGARVLFLDDPIDERWRMMFVMRLSYHDNDLVIDRAKYMPVRPTAQQIASYDYVFDFHIGQFYSAAYPHRDGPEPAIEFEREHPCVFHNDWTPVTARYPARRGEHLISMVRDLGVTEPPVSPGKPFPDSPLVDVVAPVEVRVGSRKAEVLLKIGWPQEVNKYRLDFRIPRDVRPGAELVEIRCREATGPAAPIEIE